LTFESEKALERRARRHWGLDAEQAQALAGTVLESGHAAHSREALARLVERMEDGTPYATARDELFGKRAAAEPLRELPPVLEAIPSLRNPAVCRALTELRKVVNALIGRYGTPDIIRVELARDLRNPRKRREEMAKRNRARQKERERALKGIFDQTTIASPSRADVEKVLLADECKWRCPYTGREISMDTLLGAHPQFDIEHIIPLSLSLDDSFANKTLCYHEENRARKRNHTPFQAYAADPVRWQQITERVSRFQGPLARLKLQRFLMDDAEFADTYRDFAERQLNDTRYASRLAAEYLGALYGGVCDAAGRRRVQVTPGGVTAFLRTEWELNGVLGLQGAKNRDDHRHHAVDALVIALSDARAVQQLSAAAARADQAGRRRFAPIPQPWPGVLDEARQKIMSIVVSRRVNHRLRGLLHAESLYSKPIRNHQGKQTHHIRKELHKLTPADVAGDAIVDPVIRQIIQRRLAEIGTTPGKAFADPANHPRLATRDGRSIPIHKVRVRVKANPWTIGSGPHERHVAAKAGTNHHVEIVEVTDSKGRVRINDHCVSLFEACERRRRGEPVIRRDHGPGARLLFTLYPGDCVEMCDDDAKRSVFRVANISAGDIQFRLHSDARTADQVRKHRIRATSSNFWTERGVRKVVVTHLGDVIPAND
jgi:CRISPR-associated endonuclease Csn1